MNNCSLARSQPSAAVATGTRGKSRRWLALLCWLVPVAALATPYKALESFDLVWDTVREAHFDYPSIEAAWEQARQEYRSKVAEAESQTEVRRLIQRMLDELETSHFVILGASTLPEALEGSGASGGSGRSTGIEVRIVDDQAVIWRLAEDSAALEAGLATGWVIEAFDGRKIQPLLADALAMDEGQQRTWALTFLQSMLSERLGHPGGSGEIELVVRNDRDQQITLTLAARQTNRQRFSLGALPALGFDFHSQRLAAGEDCIGYLRFSTWVPALGAEMAAAMPGLRDCMGMIIDLRGNPGGIAGMMMNVAAYFYDEPATLGTMITSAGELNFRALPRRVELDGTPVEPFTGPLAIIVDELSASTSEMFAAGIQVTGRGRVFGQPTPGMALPAGMLRLPNGDRLMYALADYVDPDGDRIEGAGITPDFLEPRRLDDLRTGIDRPLVSARDWILENISSP